jgi:hypothetical protein
MKKDQLFQIKPVNMMITKKIAEIDLTLNVEKLKAIVYELLFLKCYAIN